MKYVIALALPGGLLAELRGYHDSYRETLQYLHKHYKSFKDSEVYIIHYDGDHADYGSPYKFNVSTYYSCEDGVYYEEHYDEIDGGLGVKEIGSVLLVNNDLLPSEMQEDGELVEKALEDWVNSHLTNPKVNPATVKPNWLI